MIFKVIIGTAVFFLMFLATLFGIYTYDPTYLGFPPPKVDSVALLAQMKKKKFTIDSVKVKKTDLERMKKKNDSLGKKLAQISDSLTKIRSLSNEAKKTNEYLKLENAKIEQELTRKRDSLIRANYTVFAQMYDKANPVDVAKIISELDERDAAFILKKMKPKNAAKVLENIKPELAAAILVLSATQE